MQRQGDAAVGGAIVGALFANSRRHDRAIDRSRRAVNQAEDAEDLARQALTAATGIADSGDMARLQAAPTRDLLAGIDYPAQQPTATPEPFVGSPALVQRPALGEDLAAAATSWPGAANAYTPSGDLVTPGQALAIGQNVGLGMALGMGEVRAELMGMTQLSGPPSEEILRQHYRYTQAVALEIEDLFKEGGAGAQSLDQYRQGFRRYIAQTEEGPLLSSALLDSFNADTAVITNTTVETAIATLRIPGGSVKAIGDLLNLQLAVTAVAVNSTNTEQVRIRLDTVAGTLLFDSSAVNPTAGDSATFNVSLDATAVGSSGAFALGGMSQLSGTVRGPAVGSVSGIDLTVDHWLVITVTQSVASAGNQAKGRFGRLVLSSSS